MDIEMSRHSRLIMQLVPPHPSEAAQGNPPSRQARYEDRSQYGAKQQPTEDGAGDRVGGDALLTDNRQRELPAGG